MTESLKARITSFGDTVGGVYLKPAPERITSLVADLKDNSRAMDYLQVTRGFSPDTIENFKLGYDKEKDAIAIPVYKRGELINIRYRYLEPKANGSKYTQEKGCEVWLYNEDGIAIGQEKKGVLIVEGEFDCMSAWQAGFKNVVSPASGKDSYGVWIELLDTIPKVFISYDNDKAGKSASKAMAERVGVDKSFEVEYPEGIKDANEYFNLHTADEYKALIRKAKPFYKYTFAGVTEVIENLRSNKPDLLKLRCIPYVEFEDDWLVILSGVSNIGKTSIAMNIANELVDKNIPTLILPFERGTKTVGKRFIQTRYKRTQDELDNMSDSGWDEIALDATSLPLYFSMPSRDEIKELIAKSKRLFNTKVVIIDHLDYLVRKSGENHNIETSNTLQEFKSLAQQHSMIFIVVHHIKKQDGAGTVAKKPKMEDLKGSSSTYQDPEAVIMLSAPDKGLVEIDIVKNKGTMGSRIYEFNLATGVIGADVTNGNPNPLPENTKQLSLDEQWRKF